MISHDFHLKPAKNLTVIKIKNYDFIISFIYFVKNEIELIFMIKR